MKLSAVWRVLSQSIIHKQQIYSQYRPCALTLQQLLEFSQKGGEEESYHFLSKELLVRLANTIKEIQCLPEALLETSGLRNVMEWFSMSFSDVLAFEKVPFTVGSFENFTETMRKIYFRHSSVVEVVAEGILELKTTQENLHIPNRQIQYFLNRFLLMRISNRMLMNQHIMKFANLRNFSMHECDRIYPDCDVESVVEVKRNFTEAYGNAKFLCDQCYLTSPKMKIHRVNVLSPNEPIKITYSLAHLYHMAFELIKNSMRATVEHCGTDKMEHELPVVNVGIYKAAHDLTLKIHDQGGGVPRAHIEKLFDYHYSTAKKPSKDDRSPMAGLGFGLPLSRLYAWYFHGDLVLTSYEGYGTDACVYIKAKARDASEFLPYFNPSARKAYKNASLGSAWIHSDEHRSAPVVYNF